MRVLNILGSRDRTPAYLLPRIIIATVLLAAITLAALAGYILPVVGLVIVVIVTVFIPEYLLGAVVVMGLAGGSFASLASWASALGIVGGVTSFFLLLSSYKSINVLMRLLLPLSVLVLLGIRFLIAADPGTINIIIRCLCVVMLSAYAVFRRRDLIAAMAWACTFFIIVSLLWGELDPNGVRLMGISGNPNRMVFGLLVLLPFLIEYLLKLRNIAGYVALTLALGASFYLLWESQSSQAVAGIVLIILGAAFYFLANKNILVKYFILLMVLALLAAATLSLDFRNYVDDDLATLSGRTVLYEIAWNEFIDNMWFGIGERHVSSGALVDRSAHSSTLGILAAGGLIVGIPWIILLLSLLKSGFKLLAGQRFIGLSPLLLVMEQTVQSVEFSQLTWFIIAYFVLDKSSELKARPGDAHVSSRVQEGKSING